MRPGKATDIFFGSEIQDLSDEQLLDIFATSQRGNLTRCSDRRTIQYCRGCSSGGSGLCSSRGDARRSIEQAAGYVNNRRVESLDTNLSEQDLASDTVIVLRRGKKK